MHGPNFFEKVCSSRALDFKVKYYFLLKELGRLYLWIHWKARESSIQKFSQTQPQDLPPSGFSKIILQTIRNHLTTSSDFELPMQRLAALRDLPTPQWLGYLGIISYGAVNWSCSNYFGIILLLLLLSLCCSCCCVTLPPVSVAHLYCALDFTTFSLIGV